jgi:hypothetical protein
LTRNVYSGAGAIVDAGAFVGASAFCLATGLKENAVVGEGRPLIHSYDLFVAQDAYVVEAISRDFRPTAPGDSYLDIFERQNGDHLGLIETHPGDLLSHKWSNGPIEILFIDVAKTRELNTHIVREFFPSLIPEKSIVIQQDFYHLWHPYIHITMEYLKDYFDIVDFHVWVGSRVYRLRKPIPREELEKVAEYRFTPEEKVSLLREAANASPSPSREMLEAIIVHVAQTAGDWPLFQRCLAEFEQNHSDLRQSSQLWAKQLVRAVWNE